MKTRRRKLSPLKREKLSHQACSALDRLPELSACKVILGYLALPEELTIDPLIYQWQKSGKKVGIPVVTGDELEPCLLPSKDGLTIARFGLREPAPDARRYLPEQELQAIILPGLAFDSHGHRLGYGKGYYDRFLSRLPQRPLLVGVGFDFQVAPEIPWEPHDFPLDLIATPSEVIRVS